MRNIKIICVSIARELHEYFTENGIKAMNKDLQSHLMYVAINSNKIIGFLTIQQKNNRVVEISWMAIKREYQRQGIGSALVNYIADNLKVQGVKLLEVKTLSEETEYLSYENTRKFYKKNGFIHLETINPYPKWDPGCPCAIYVWVFCNVSFIKYDVKFFSS